MDDGTLAHLRHERTGRTFLLLAELAIVKARLDAAANRDEGQQM